MPRRWICIKQCVAGQTVWRSNADFAARKEEKDAGLRPAVEAIHMEIWLMVVDHERSEAYQQLSEVESC